MSELSELHRLAATAAAFTCARVSAAGSTASESPPNRLGAQWGCCIVVTPTLCNVFTRPAGLGFLDLEPLRVARIRAVGFGQSEPHQLGTPSNLKCPLNPSVARGAATPSSSSWTDSRSGSTRPRTVRHARTSLYHSVDAERRRREPQTAHGDRLVSVHRRVKGQRGEWARRPRREGSLGPRHNLIRDAVELDRVGAGHRPRPAVAGGAHLAPAVVGATPDPLQQHTAGNARITA